MVTHYSCGYANDFCMKWLRDYAGFWVSIFFALSGFGIYYSFQRLEAHFGTRELSLRLVGTFYWERALRIYPLFWLSVFTASFIMYGWTDLHFLSVRTIAVYLAFPTVRGPGFIWFIPMLVQCYILAPFLYFLLKSLRLKLYLVFVAALCAFFMLVSYYYLHLLDLINGFGIPDPEALFYGPIFLANLLIFALGMTIPLLKDQLKPYLGVSAIVISSIAFLTTLFLVRDADRFFIRSHFVFYPLFIFSVFALCLSVITANRSLPLGRPVSYLGIYSY